jgi:hypothetical protein
MLAPSIFHTSITKLHNAKLTIPAQPCSGPATGEITVRNAVLLQQAMVSAMIKAGVLAHGEITAIRDGLTADGLSGMERLTAIASTVAAITAKRHAAEAEGFLRCLQNLTRPTSGFAQIGERGDNAMRRDRILMAVGRLGTGFDRLAQTLADAPVAGDQATAVEIVLLARLLAAHRPNLIRSALLAVARAVAAPGFQPGEIVTIDAEPSQAMVATSEEALRRAS